MPQQRYEEVAADLRRRIETGEYRPGSRMPSRTELAAMYQISDTVSDKAMLILRQLGLVETLPGVGVFVVDRTQSTEVTE